ncbi:hypothetical protein, partial [Streptococcus suis]|uniref:hypothetical protein n=1 Tax=Streptococcus suis TaxID=1307 RepID=UPI00370B1DA5
RQHESSALPDTLDDGLDSGCRCMTSHGTSVAKTEVDILVTVNVFEVGTTCSIDEYGIASG